MTNQRIDDERLDRDEIDLVDIWLKVARYRLAFFGAIVVVLVLGMAVYFLLPQKFEHKVMIEIGGVWTGTGIDGGTAGRFEFVETPDVVKVKIEESFVPEAIARARETAADEVPDDVSVDVPKDTGIVRVTVKAPLDADPAVAALLSDIAGRVLESHNQLLENRVRVLRELTEGQMRELDRRIGLLQTSRTDVAKNASVEAKGIALLMVDTSIQDLIVERNTLQREMEVGLMLNTRPSRIIAGPVHDNRPAGPGPALAVALSLLIGVVVGFGIVLLLNIRESAIERATSRAAR